MNELVTRLAACGGSAIMEGIFSFGQMPKRKNTLFPRVVAAGHDEAEV